MNQFMVMWLRWPLWVAQAGTISIEVTPSRERSGPTIKVRVGHEWIDGPYRGWGLTKRSAERRAIFRAHREGEGS